MDIAFTLHIPQLFPYGSLYLVTPFWDDVDIQVVGDISYQVYLTGNPLLDTVNTIISNEENINFSGHWMLVAEWNSVPAYDSSPNQVDTILAIMIEDQMKPISTFLAKCTVHTILHYNE